MRKKFLNLVGKWLLLLFCLLPGMEFEENNRFSDFSAGGVEFFEVKSCVIVVYRKARTSKEDFSDGRCICNNGKLLNQVVRSQYSLW